MTTAKSKLHPLIVCLLAGTFLSRIALFISLPYLSIHLTARLGASPLLAGIVVGLGPLCGIIGAFLMGYISDKTGRRKILEISLLTWSVAFLGFAFSTHVWQFAAFNMLYGFSRSSFESVTTALLADITTTETRKKVFHWRYFYINLAASIAPLIGAWILIQHPTWGFIITSSVYFLYFIVLHLAMNRWHQGQKGSQPATITFDQVIHTLRTDRVLFMFLTGNFLMLLGFAQLESNLPQYLNSLFSNKGIQLYSYIMMANGLTIVFFQHLLNHSTRNLGLVHATIIGFFLFMIGLSSFGLFETHAYWMIGSMVILSLGEILVFSNSYLLIDQLSPSHLKGSYFGITELCSLGFVLGPGIGGWLLQLFGGPVMFVVLGNLTMISVYLFLRGNRLKTLR